VARDHAPGSFEAFEIEGWNAIGGRYDSFFGGIASEAAAHLLRRIEVAGARLLDVGCGTGALAVLAGAAGATVEAADPAPAMAEAAQGRGIPAVVATGEALPFDDAAFDVVAANLVLPHLERPEEALREWRRVVRPGGRVALSTWDHPVRAALFGLFLEAMRAAGAGPPAELPPGPDPFRWAAPGELEHLLSSSRLEDVAVDSVSWRHPVESADELWTGMLTTTVRLAATVNAQPEPVRARIRDEFAALTAGSFSAVDCSILVAKGRRTDS
jgi:SAM-dependent methyltransferase